MHWRLPEAFSCWHKQTRTTQSIGKGRSLIKHTKGPSDWPALKFEFRRCGAAARARARSNAARSKAEGGETARPAPAAETGLERGRRAPTQTCLLGLGFTIRRGAAGCRVPRAKAARARALRGGARGREPLRGAPQRARRRRRKRGRKRGRRRRRKRTRFRPRGSGGGGGGSRGRAGEQASGRDRQSAEFSSAGAQTRRTQRARSVAPLRSLAHALRAAARTHPPSVRSR